MKISKNGYSGLSEIESGNLYEYDHLVRSGGERKLCISPVPFEFLVIDNDTAENLSTVRIQNLEQPVFISDAHLLGIPPEIDGHLLLLAIPEGKPASSIHGDGSQRVHPRSLEPFSENLTFRAESERHAILLVV